MNKKIHITRADAKSFRIKGGTNGIIYPDHPKGEHTIAHITMRGKYPVVGYSINATCTETIVMLKGKMKIRTGSDIHEMRRDDVLVIMPNVKYRIEGEGEVLDVITPRWDKKQNSVVEDSTFTTRP